MALSSLLLAPELVGDAGSEAGGDFLLAHNRPILDPAAIDQMNGVAIAAEDAGCGRHIVGEDPVAALAHALVAGVAEDILGLGGEADHQRRPVVPARRNA